MSKRECSNVLVGEGDEKEEKIRGYAYQVSVLPSLPRVTV